MHMNKQSRRAPLVIAAIALCVVAILVLAFLRPVGPLPNPQPDTKNLFTPTDALDMKVSVIDVGQGDAILVESEGHVLLVDAGITSAGKRTVDYLEDEGIVEIDYVVTTHPDADHIGGMPSVFAAFIVKNDVFAPALTSDTATYRNFVAAVDAEPGVSLAVPVVGASYDLGDATFEILANGDGATKPNNASIVIKVTCDGKSILLTGDLTEKEERQLVAAGALLASDVLKVGHHGSATSTCDEFLFVVRPSIAVISCGKNNSYGHPADATIKRLTTIGAVVYRTDESGTIIFLFSDGTITPIFEKAA